MKKLAQGLVIQYRPFDWLTKDLGDMKTIDPNGIVIVEGVSVLREQLDLCFYKKILVVSNSVDEFDAI